jgi:hypothetical protein
MIGIAKQIAKKWSSPKKSEVKMEGFDAPRMPIVLCHGLFGFAVLGTFR